MMAVLQAVEFSTALQPEQPERCPEADRLRGKWYFALGDDQPAALVTLQAHMRTCLICIRRNTWATRAAAMANMPDLSEDEIESGERSTST